MKMMMKWTHTFGFAMAFAGLVAASVPALAQALDPETVLPPRVEGTWVRTDTNGSGQFGALTSKFPPAELTPQAKENAANQQQQNRPPQQRVVNGIVVTNPTPCIYNGGQLTLEVDSEGFIAVQSKKEVVFVQDRGSDRHVYLDQKMRDASMRAPSPSGYSIGHIEPDGTLVITTSDMTPGRVTAGGFRTPKTVLEQRYIPDPDGKHLKAVFTWNDPEIYVKPHTYTYTFERLPKGSTSLDEFCDATNPLEGQSVAPPPQK